MSRVSQIPRGVWALGFVSLLADISSELIHSLLPVFLVSVLGASAVTVGFIEGVGEATALVARVFSGALSDYLGKRKALAVLGYGLAALTKPLFAVATSAGMVLSARVIDRIGKGIRGAPRDALVADIAPAHVRGAAYGLRQSLDTVGAFAGPLLAMALMMTWSNDFRAVFCVAIVPGLLAVAVLLVGVREPERLSEKRPRNPIRWHEIARLSEACWWVVAIGAVVTLARFSEAFLILLAHENGVPLAWVPLVLVLMNVAYAVSAFPAGRMADRMSHSRLLALGLMVLIVADVILAFGRTWIAIGLGVALWGLHMGITQGLLATMVADAALPEKRGTAFGVFGLLSGLAMLVASALAGWLWARFGSPFTFSAGALFCVLGLCGIALRPGKARTGESG